MKSVSEFIKSTLIGGLLVVLPLGLVVMIVMKIVAMLRQVVAPIADRLPHGLRFPDAIAVGLLIAGCFAAGLLARTRAGQGAGSLMERGMLNYIPGYTIVRSFVRRLGDVDESEKFAPALVEIEDALVPAFIVEEHADGHYTVFVPSAPTPGVGSIYIMTPERVHLVDAPFMKAVKCISRWGVGSAELLKAMRPPATDFASQETTT